MMRLKTLFLHKEETTTKTISIYACANLETESLQFIILSLKNVTLTIPTVLRKTVLKNAFKLKTDHQQPFRWKIINAK